MAYVSLKSCDLTCTVICMLCVIVSGSDLVPLRHARAKIRRSSHLDIEFNEYKNLQWSLKALDNLTVRYDLNGVDENVSSIIFENDPWTYENLSFLNITGGRNNLTISNENFTYEKTAKNFLYELNQTSVNTGPQGLKNKSLIKNTNTLEKFPRPAQYNQSYSAGESVNFPDTLNMIKSYQTPNNLIVESIRNSSEDKKKPGNNVNNHHGVAPGNTSIINEAVRLDRVSENRGGDILLEEILAANDKDVPKLDENNHNRINLHRGRDVVTRFLQIVESQHLLGANCTAGTALNLGEGVVDQYAQERFRIEAEVAVNRANMLTRIFKQASPSVQASEHLLHASVLSMVEFDDDIFAAGNCFDLNQHPSKLGLFCPFAYRLPPPDQGASFAKDLAAEYHYLGNTSEWFFLARKNAEKVIAKNNQHTKAYHLYSDSTNRESDVILTVKYEDGRWSKPYYDCGGGNIWMMTYTVPFFGYSNGTYFFKGTSGIDIDLRRVDIDQCPQNHVQGLIQPLNIFAGTDKCKQRTTMCEPITGLGFRRGSYKCLCRPGFYFPDLKLERKYFNGSVLEEEYERLMLGLSSLYNKSNSFECLPCAEGCDVCEDNSPCVALLNWPMRTSILMISCIVIGFLPPTAWFTYKFNQIKVVRAASPALLRVIVLGAFLIYCTTIIMYPKPTVYTCLAKLWFREIGFSLTYGALMLKTWRISVIFRVRSAKAVKITDAFLLKRLGFICLAISFCLLVKTVISPPEVITARTADDLKAFLCRTDWWDHIFTTMEVSFLAWGIRLCIMVRKAPSEFNESRFISMAIYNEFLLTCFLNVSMFFLQSPANPDLLYIIFFCHTQLTVTLLLALIFGSKVYIVFCSTKAQENMIGLGAKSSNSKLDFRSQIRTLANQSTTTSSAAQLAEMRLSDQEALEEIRQVCVQLKRIQDLAPQRGLAAITVANILDNLKTLSHIGTSSSISTKSYALPLTSQNNCRNDFQTTKNIADKAVDTISMEGTMKETEHTQHIINHSAEVCRLKIENNVSFSELHLDCMCKRMENFSTSCTESQYETEQNLSQNCTDFISHSTEASLEAHAIGNDEILFDLKKSTFFPANLEMHVESFEHISTATKPYVLASENGRSTECNQNEKLNLLVKSVVKSTNIEVQRGQKLVLDLTDRSKYTKEVSV